MKTETSQPLTPNQKKRVLDALAEVNRFIEKEEAMSDDLRPADVQQILETSRAHRAKLVRMLEPGYEHPSPW